ncbi:MAG: hypothetical protein DRJ64_08830 [Thermoprotei archaeon]|nr:MAG: hypothetical protein DRJ64_08830 [Thermoprotei archaeon]
MAISTIDHLMVRIDEAEYDSPIAVFKPPRATPGLLEGVFGATLETRRCIKEGKKGGALFVGCFHKEMNRNKTLSTLLAAAE